MKNTKNHKFIFAVEVILGALTAIGVKFLFHGCRSMEGDVTRCAGAENAVFVLGIIMFAAALIGCIVKNRTVRLLVSVVFTVLAVLVIVLPGNVLPLCMMPEMRCLMVMRPATIVIGIISAVIGAVGLLFSIRKEGR